MHGGVNRRLTPFAPGAVMAATILLRSYKTTLYGIGHIRFAPIDRLASTPRRDHCLEEVVSLRVTTGTLCLRSDEGTWRERLNDAALDFRLRNLGT